MQSWALLPSPPHIFFPLSFPLRFTQLLCGETFSTPCPLSRVLQFAECVAYTVVLIRTLRFGGGTVMPILWMRKRRPKQLVHGLSAISDHRLRASHARVAGFPCKPINLVQPWVEPLTWGGAAGGDGMSNQVWSQADLTSHKSVNYFCGQLPNIAYNKHRKGFDSFWPLL